jgi:hypothetical protein
MKKRIVTAALIIVLAGFLVTISALELPVDTAEKAADKPTIHLGR